MPATRIFRATPGRCLSRPRRHSSLIFFTGCKWWGWRYAVVLVARGRLGGTERGGISGGVLLQHRGTRVVAGQYEYARSRRYLAGRDLARHLRQPQVLLHHR
jgi:hypothetical protein